MGPKGESSIAAYQGIETMAQLPSKDRDQDHLHQYRVDFAKLPLEIYELTR